MDHGRVFESSALSVRLVAPNPGPTTLQGTNTYLLRAPGSRRTIVVDPGPADEGHLARIQTLGPVELILLTHRHADHAGGAGALARRTGAPVRAWDAASCTHGAPLRHGETIRAAGLEIDVLHAPGHTADSVVLRVPADGPVGGPFRGSALTGDTILGRGTSLVVEPDGSLAEHLATLDVLVRTGSGILALPGHGPVLPDLAETAAAYLRHRAERLREVRAVLRTLGLPAVATTATVATVVSRVYADVPAESRPAAEASVRAQLAYLAG